MEFPVRSRFVTGILLALVLSACGGGSGSSPSGVAGAGASAGAVAGASAGSGIVFSPSTVSCSNPDSFTETITLPQPPSGNEVLNWKFDGRPTFGFLTSTQTLTQMSANSTAGAATGQATLQNGIWTIVFALNADEVTQVCNESAGGSGSFAVGPHAVEVSSSKDTVSGSYTVTK
jgi:hypothetical protein